MQVAGNVTIPEPIVLNNFGPGFDPDTMGALYNFSDSNTWSGTVTLGTTAANSIASVGAAASTTLTITGSVRSLPGAAGNSGDNQLFKFGQGDVVLGGTTDNVTNATVTVLLGKLILNKDTTTNPDAHPFYGNLVIGDNRDGVAGKASVELLGFDNQIPEVNFFGTTVNSVVINSNGSLDLKGKTDTIGSLAMLLGRNDAADVAIGAGTLSLMGDIVVNGTVIATAAAFQGSSGSSPAATISGTGGGKLNLGTFFSGAAAWPLGPLPFTTPPCSA